MTAATCGLPRIRHPSLTMPGEGGLQSMTITRRAASQRRNYKLETKDIRVVVLTFIYWQNDYAGKYGLQQT